MKILTITPLFLHIHATIDLDDLTADIRREVAGQINGCVGDIGPRAEPASWQYR